MESLARQLQDSERVPVRDLLQNTRALVEAIPEHNLDSEHIVCTLFRWLGQLEAFRVATMNAYMAQNTGQGAALYNQHYSGLYRAILAGYKQVLSPMSWGDFYRAENLLLLEERCTEYLDSFESVMIVDDTATIAKP